MKAKHLVILDFATMSHRYEISPSCLYDHAVTTDCYALTAAEDAAERIGDADAVICNKVPISAQVMDACPNLRYIGLLATGYNNVDLPAADARGITVCNAGSYSTNAVAQLVFAYILDHYEKLALYNADVRLGKWIGHRTFSYFPYPTMELAGKTMAIVGYGSIGKAVAKIADAFGMQVVIATRTTPENCPYPVVSVPKAFACADVLSVHCPLNEASREMVCHSNLRLMKPEAILINTARGGVVNEQDLADALNSDRLAAAYVDVLNQEPMAEDTPLRTAKNCTITSHIAWTPMETRERLLAIAAENLQCYFDGVPRNVVNCPVHNKIAGNAGE